MLPTMKERDVTRRAHALLALGLFLFGTNVCVFAPPASLAAPLLAAVAPASVSAEHPCCAKACAPAGNENAPASEQASPCCVAVAPVVAAHGANVEPAPMIALPAVIAPSVLPVTLPEIERLALAEDTRPPAPPAATPDAGRAPPRL